MIAWRALLGLGLATITRLAGSEAAPVADLTSARASAIEVRVVPDCSERIYRRGETPRFRVAVLADQQRLAGVKIRYAVGLENMPARETTVIAGDEDLIVAGEALTTPGFIRCVVKAEVAGQSYRGTATVGFAPEKLAPTQTEPADFDEFWGRGRAALTKVPLEPRLELIPEASTGAINVYHVSFRTWSRSDSAPSPSRIYGILCEPKKPGHYPAFLRVPAAGVRSYRGERTLAEQGAITLEIGIHGMPVNGPAEIYAQLRSGALEGYAQFNLDDPERYFYRRVHLGCLQALEFLRQRKHWDGKSLIVFGASQGGMLALATAALDPQVTAVAGMIPAYCDVTGYLHRRAGGWPHLFRAVGNGRASPEKVATTAYYDTVNFARRLRCPVLVTVGYNDENCAPTTVYSAFNVISAPKELVVALEAGHTVTPEMDARVRTWLAEQAGLHDARLHEQTREH